MSKQRDKDKQKRAAEKAASKVSQDPQGEASGNQAITPKGQTKPAPKAGKHQKTGTTGQTPPWSSSAAMWRSSLPS